MKTEEERPDLFGTNEARNFPEDYNQENGNYINMCRDCGLSFRGNKHRMWCRMCEEPNWEELAKIQRPERVDPIPGAWLQGEMVGFARCMVKKVKPLLAVSEEKDRRIRELEEAQNWKSVDDGLPETRKPVQCIVWSIKGDPIQLICEYTKGEEIEAYNYITDEEVMLPAGFYECEEQQSGDSDEQYFKREVTHWMPLPNPPKP